MISNGFKKKSVKPLFEFFGSKYCKNSLEKKLADLEANGIDGMLKSSIWPQFIPLDCIWFVAKFAISRTCHQFYCVPVPVGDFISQYPTNHTLDRLKSVSIITHSKLNSIVNSWIPHFCT